MKYIVESQSMYDEEFTEIVTQMAAAITYLKQIESKIEQIETLETYK
jgi:hypothetical protein